jgi:hypothetical protein
MVFFNYVVQTTFVPGLVRGYTDLDAHAVSAFAMANPRSLAWALEMWGYGFLGVATWLVAPVFAGNAVERATAHAFRANGVVSVIGALWTALQPGWVFTPARYLAFGAWNVLVFAMAALAQASLARREHEPMVKRLTVVRGGLRSAST